MSGADFITYIRGLHHHTFVYHYMLVFITGGLFLASVEFLAYVIGLVFKKKSAN